jgi:hypothetical protein
MTQALRPPKRHVPLDPNNLPHRAVKERPAQVEDFIPPKRIQLTPISQGLYADPIQVASAGDITGLLTSTVVSATIPPTSADLAETVEVRFTAAIANKAADLGHNPLNIYNWVRNNVDFVPTYGSIQGADYCLQTLECNAFDTSSLLIALLRASGIHARYAMGTVEMPIDRFTNWVGGFNETPEGVMAALDFASTGGIKTTGLREGGVITRARIEHVWVEAWVDMIPSMGAVHRVGDTWTPLDASFKQYVYTEGMDLRQDVPYDIEGLAQSVLNTIETDIFGNVVGVDLSMIDSAIETQRNAESEYINANYPDMTIDEFLGAKEIVHQQIKIFPGTLPYPSALKSSRHQALPDSLRHKITFSIAPSVSYYYVEPFSITLNLSELAGKRINIGYFPETETDSALLLSYVPDYNSAIPINPSLLPAAFPAYALQVKPALMLDDVVVAWGGAIGLGMTENFTMTFVSPSNSDDIVRNTVTAGEQLGVTIVTASISEVEMKSVKSTVGTGNNKVGSLLSATSFIYCYELGLADKHYAHTMDVSNVLFPSEALFKQRVSTEMSFGVPISVNSSGLVMDVDRYLSLVKSRDGDYDNKLQFMYVSGAASSALEHLVPEYIYSTEANPVVSISAVKAIRLAAEAGIPLRLLDSESVDAFVSDATIDSYVKDAVQDAVNQGKYVLVPLSNITVGGWTGAGYIAIDPESGSGAYMISDGYGGAITMSRNLAAILMEIETIQMYVEGARQMPTGQKALRLTQDAVLLPSIGLPVAFGIALYHYMKMQIQWQVFGCTMGDKYNHCMAFCRSTKMVGPLSSYIMGILKECFDEAHQELTGRIESDGFQLEDIEANMLGITVPIGMSCEDRCITIRYKGEKLCD